MLHFVYLKGTHVGEEGRVHYCSWELADEGYVGWVTSRPSLRAAAPTRSHLERLLGRAITQVLGDERPTLEFDPPLHVCDSESGLFRDGLVLISWNVTLPLPTSGVAPFTRADCPKCGHGGGARTPGHELSAKGIPRGMGGAVVVPSGPRRAASPLGGIQVVSDSFLARLLGRERVAFDVRPLTRVGRSKAFFLELVPDRFVSPVALRGRPVSGWHCKACGTADWAHPGSVGPGISVISRDELPSDPCFFVGDARRFRLCLPAERWRAFRGRPFARGMLAHPLAVAADRLCLRGSAIPAMFERAGHTPR